MHTEEPSASAGHLQRSALRCRKYNIRIPYSWAVHENRHIIDGCGLIASRREKRIETDGNEHEWSAAGIYQLRSEINVKWHLIQVHTSFPLVIAMSRIAQLRLLF